MKRFFCVTILFFFCFSVLSQNKILNSKTASVSKKAKSSSDITGSQPKKPTFDQYRIFTLQKDTTYVDTSLTVKRDYEYNYLRKDIFGLLPFANEGQTYMVLDHGLNKLNPFPEIGFSGKQFNYLGAEDIKYYNVATPVTELYYKTVMVEGQSLDAFITLNTSKRFNMSVAYKGLRSKGHYLNQLSSTGNFRFTSSYNTLNKRYYINFHFTEQDFRNHENGGITTVEDFESGDQNYKDRSLLQVYLTDAQSFIRGNRTFFDHDFRLNKDEGVSNWYLTHQFNYENKFFEYTQPTIPSMVGNKEIYRFGDSYVSSDLRDNVHYNRMYNKAGIVYENSNLGEFRFFMEDFRYNNYYDKVLVLDSGVIPSSISDQINTLGGQYEYRKKKWSGVFLYSNSITDQSLINLDAHLKYRLNPANEFVFHFQMINKLPDHIYNLHQSDYVNYNWYHDFKNEKIEKLEVTAKTQWFDASLQLSSLTDYLYFSNDNTEGQQIISPKQYGKTINYFEAKLAREFKWKKFALDNTFLFQAVDQTDDILNVPAFVTRNTLYFSDYYFSKALYVQTGITFNYFTNYYANDYNPVIAESFVQNQKQIGNFPMFDFFINGRIRQTRIFLKAEHFNSGFSKINYYTAPNYPYRDFMIRFGLVWNFFK